MTGKSAPLIDGDQAPAYAELHCISNYSFLRGASFPEELVHQAARLGYRALAITDECSLSGVVRAHVAAKEHGLQLIVGSEFQLEDELRFVLLAMDRHGYGNLSQLITIARSNAKKGKYQLSRDDVERHCPHACIALWLPGEKRPDENQLLWLAKLFPQQTWIVAELLLSGDDQRQLRRLYEIGARLDIPLCAAGKVYMHHRKRRMLQDTLTAIRVGKPISELGYELFPNGERYLRSRPYLRTIYPPESLAETIRIADLCRFSLDELRYEYPRELVPKGYTPRAWLYRLVKKGAKWRWPNGASGRIWRLIHHELTLVNDLGYEPYFLTVHDIVHYAQGQGILCQGRGSAANSVICYCLGITEVDPGRMELLFERFISKERNEPPDIDVDFEHERREEVIQYIYRKYGRDRAALAATVVTYKPRSAVRDVGKALGMSLDQVDLMAKSIQWWDKNHFARDQLAANGFSMDNPLIKRLLYLVRKIAGFPRHLSQHVGGFVISAGQLSQLVPIENASMPGRTVIQWEKNDLAALGLLKIDILSLGMLTAIRKALQLISGYSGKSMALADIPAEDPRVYAMIQKADTIGVFQIESRAQMTMLPRLKPRCYYDLVIEIAIIRPGPIQGDMVHPYLARRNGKESVTYPSAAVQKVLQRTLGVPIFQEQVMQLAMVAAGFTAGEADQLRRCMTTWQRRGGLEQFEEKLLRGMTERGYAQSFAQQIVNQIRGFGEYGFPESHSASFALLAYASSWLKCYHPAAFTCALLNSQPMGFYAPAQLVQDAKRHGVEVLPIAINHSEDDCSLEMRQEEPRNKKPLAQPMLRLGFRMVKGLSKAGINRLLQARNQALFTDVQDFVSRAGLKQADMQCLAAANVFEGLAGDRHRAFWQVAGAEFDLPVFGTPHFTEAEVMLPRPSEGENIIADYTHIGLTVNRHPLALLRKRLTKLHVRRAIELYDLPNGAHSKAAGLVISRQQPGTASGVIFVTLEDESGHINLVVWPKVAQRQRQALLKSRLLVVSGTIQQEEGVLHLIARRLEDYSRWLGSLSPYSRDFC